VTGYLTIIWWAWCYSIFKKI